MSRFLPSVCYKALMTKSPEDAEQLAHAREVMARRREALRVMSEMELAEQIMREDEDILRQLAKD